MIWGVSDLKKSSWNESDTEKAIRNFQKENWLKVDWVPWKKTIQKLLDWIWAIGNVDDKADKKDEEKDKKGELSEKEDVVESKIYTQDELFALEIYRWKNMLDEQIEKAWYDPKKIWELVKDKEKMEEMDKILPNFVKWQESDIWNSKKQKDSDDQISENSQNLQWDKKTEQIIENQDWSKDNEERTIVENMVVEPKFSEKNKFYLENRQEYINNTDILQWPKLAATNIDELWWIWSSMMAWFAWYIENREKYGYGNIIKKMLCGEWWTTRSFNWFWKDWQKWVLDEEKLKKYCEDNWIKSFMFYFWWNEAATSQMAVDNAYNDIRLMWEYLQSIWVQPVLCTCIWENKKEHSIWHREQKYPLVEFNQKIRSLWQEKNWPVIDYASIDIWNVQYETPDKIHPNNGEYLDMRQKILENLSN